MSEKKVFPDGAWPVAEFLRDACADQIHEFDEQCENNPHFDWDLEVEGEKFAHGTPWHVRSGRTGHIIQPHVLIVDGKLWYIGYYVESGGRSVTVVPLRRNPARSGAVEVGVVYQVRAFAGTEDHPNCRIMAGLPRGATNDGESVADGAVRETQEETGCPVERMIKLASLRHDANLVKGAPFVTYAAWMAEPNGSAELDPSEKILKFEWLTVPKLLARFAQGVTTEDFGSKGQLEVNWGGSLEFFPLILAQAEVSEFAIAWANGLLEHSAKS